MRTLFIAIAFILITKPSIGQTIAANQLLNKAISYHDPNGNWSTFNGKLNIIMETPNASKRISEIQINLPKEFFYVKAKRDTTTTEYTITKEKCKIVLNGKSNLNKEELERFKLSCKRASMYKNYYTYLYGLPMKLKDAGTNIDKTVVLKKFKKKEYLVLKASYDNAVGNDIWYFYFNPKTFAMEVYQFFKTDKDGKQKNNSGEYIILSDELIINGIIMPKNRAWYTNKDNTYLGTDILN